MSLFLDSVTTKLVSSALDLNLLRHQVIAGNIANASTGGYQALAVDAASFQEKMHAIVHSTLPEDLQITALEDMDKSLPGLVMDSGEKVVLDDELVSLNKNVTEYQAILAAYKNYGALMTSAIRGGK